jgi:hypothetical protein
LPVRNGVEQGRSFPRSGLQVNAYLARDGLVFRDGLKAETASSLNDILSRAAETGEEMMVVWIDSRQGAGNIRLDGDGLLGHAKFPRLGIMAIGGQCRITDEFSAGLSDAEIAGVAMTPSGVRGCLVPRATPFVHDKRTCPASENYGAARGGADHHPTAGSALVRHRHNPWCVVGWRRLRTKLRPAPVIAPLFAATPICRTHAPLPAQFAEP